MKSEEKLAELLPCPFCGSDAYCGGNGPFRVNCKQCNASLGPLYVMTAAEAIAAWNRRALSGHVQDGQPEGSTSERATRLIEHACSLGIGYGVTAHADVLEEFKEAKNSAISFVCSALAASPAHSQPEAVRVKPLVWEHRVANAAGGVYDVSRYGKYWAVYLNNNLISEPESEEAAKAAAQQDYTNRILSAIEPEAVSRADVIEECARVAESFTAYTWRGSENENTLGGMYSRGNKNALVKIAAAIRNIGVPHAARS